MRIRALTVPAIGLLCCMVYSAGVQAQVPKAHLPDGPRPRLWVTQERLEALSKARTNNTAGWKLFKADCAKILKEKPYDGELAGIAPMALMYLLTKDEQYANRAFVYMDQVASNVSAYHAPEHAGIEAMALGYDWLHGHPKMAAKRKSYAQKMIGLSNSLWNNHNGKGVNRSGTDSDSNILSGVVHLMLGAALHGDDPGAESLLDRGWMEWVRGYGADQGPPQRMAAQPAREVIRRAVGGHFYTGWMYFMSTDAVGINGYWLTLSTAFKYDVNTLEPDLARFWPNVIRTTLDLTDPPREYFAYTGDWQDSWGLAELPWYHQLLSMAAFQAERAGSPKMAAYARWLKDQAGDRHLDLFLEFFLSDPGLPSTDPYSAGLPKVRFADNPDWMFFRSGWGKSATWGMLSGNGAEPADHLNPEPGGFHLYREDDYLTRACRVYGPLDGGMLFNILTIKNTNKHGTPLDSDYESHASIDRFRAGQDTPLFAYAMVQSDGQYDTHPALWDPINRVDSYRRHFFWSGEYVVVFDRLRTKDKGWSIYHLRALSEPTLEGNTITQLSSNGRQKLIHRTLEPSDATFQVMNEKTDLGKRFEDYQVARNERQWQTQIRPPVSTRANLLNVMQMGPASMTGFDTLEHLSGDGNSGVRIGGWVVVFASEEALRDTLSYTVSKADVAMHHLVADLEPGAYEVRVNGAVQQVPVQPESHSAFFQTEAGGGALKIEIAKVGELPDAGPGARDAGVGSSDSGTVTSDGGTNGQKPGGLDGGCRFSGEGFGPWALLLLLGLYLRRSLRARRPVGLLDRWPVWRRARQPRRPRRCDGP